MSLQLAAQHMASRGRGPDTQLVHMSKGEVAGLQALAKAHGGTLTTNPHTGLPEAGFLQSILPTLIGAGLTMTGVGAPLAAAMVAGGYTAATGDLKKGLIAGLGAYGGAGLAGAATSAGTTTGLQAASGEATAIGDAAAKQALTQGATSTTGTTGIAGLTGTEGAAQGVGTPLTGMEATTTPVAGAPTEAVATQAPPAEVPATQTAPVEPTAGTAGPAAKSVPYEQMKAAGFTDEQIAQSAREWGSNAAGTAQGTAFSPATQSALQNPTAAGISGLSSEAGQKAFMQNVGGTQGLVKYGYAAALPAIMAEPDKKNTPVDKEQYRYSYDVNRNLYPQSGYSGAYTGERSWFSPRFTRQYAGGGPVEDLSNRNAALTLMADGGQMYAEGGETEAPKSTQSQQALDYLMGKSGSSQAQAPQSTQSQDAYAYLMGQQAQSAPAGIAALPVDSGVAPAEQGQSRPGFEKLDQFTFDPRTKTFTRVYTGNENYIDPNAYVASFDAAAKNGGLMALAAGGQSHLGDYSDGGRLLRGPGDGVSDSIPATIADKRPARLADGEFVVPARIVSELGNGSTDAGARKLYAMMDRIQKARGKTTGKNRVAVDSKAEKMLPV